MTLVAGLGSAVVSGAGSSASAGNVTLLSAITTLTLTGNLRVCLDAGDSASYGGSGQTWTSVASGAYSFFRGATSSAEASDPAFNGLAGALSGSEYFTLNGSQWFTLNQTNPAWVQTLHKANAVLTFMAVVYIPTISSLSQAFGILGDLAAAAGPGIEFGSSSSSLASVNLACSDAAGNPTVYNRNTATKLKQNSWNFISVSANMSTGNVIFVTNGTSETFTSQSYSSPSASSAGDKLQLDSYGGNTGPFTPTGSRRAMTAIWDVALTSANLVALYNAVKSRYGMV